MNRTDAEELFEGIHDQEWFDICDLLDYCYLCVGSGMIYYEMCKECHGTGKQSSFRKLDSK